MTDLGGSPPGGAEPLEVRAVERPAVEAARLVAACLREALRRRGRATVAFSGGSTAGPMLDALALADEVDWSRVHVLQVDERVAPDGHADRNATALLERLVRPAAVPEGNVHLVPVDGPDPHAAASAYAETLRRVAGPDGPVLDVVHLGLGADGHTASLFPGDPALDVTADDVVPTGPHGGHRRVTMTLPVLDRAARRVWLVAGDGKADALRRLVAGDRSIPAARVARERAVVVTDRPWATTP